MKKAIFILTLFVASVSYGQGLTEKSEYVKENRPDTYERIKKDAVKEWGEDHEMILYKINNQCASYVECLQLYNSDGFDKQLLTSAFNKWSVVHAEDDVSTDWEMVLYEYKNQLKAKNAY